MEMPELTMEMPELLDENIFEILSRLPVKSLMRFKCVSKPWCSLISDPKFIKAHLFQQGKKSRKILLCTPHQAGILDYEDCENSIAELNYPFAIQSGPRVEFVGSCDGLVCLLFDFDTFIVWNPSTKEFRQLSPCIPISSTYDNDMSRHYPDFFGFGYDSSIDDYKVVIGFWLHHLADPIYTGDCEVQVLSLKSNNWKSTKFHIAHFFMGPSTHFNGNLLSLTFGSQPNEVILSFNIKDEKFTEVVPPVLADFLPDSYQIEFNVSENSLSLSAFCISFDADSVENSYFEEWEKNADVVENSWKKLYGVPLQISFLQRCETNDFLLCFTANHKLLLNFGENILRTYDVVARTSKDFRGNCSPDSDAIVYVETLVSPN